MPTLKGKIAVPILAGLLVLILASCGGEAAPSQTPDPRIDEIIQQLGQVAEQVRKLEELAAAPATPTPSPTLDSMVMDESTPTPTETAEASVIQEIGLIENYAATRFYPKWMVVVKDIPVRIYLTRLHREHVNEFTINPFYRSSDVILPGEIGVIDFVPDQVGEFFISNVGHRFEATLVVVETEEEAKRLSLERGRQMFSLIHSIDDFKIFPESLVIQNDLPTTIHNISLVAEHKVSFKPFHTPEDLNVRPKEISLVEFTPGTPGDYSIFHELHGITGQLIVEGNE